ncbi:flavodoxin-dependent (E)-4-hydroxy-3-methylbut-2-enyl-diphosphate synthase [Caulobacter segnis]
MIQAARDHGCSMRIGVNASSLERELLESTASRALEAMVESALNHAASCRITSFHEFKISVEGVRPVQ